MSDMTWIALALVLTGIILEIVGIKVKSKEILFSAFPLLIIGVVLCIIRILRSLI